MAAKWPENGAMEETSRNSAWRFGEVRRRSTSPMALVGLPRAGAPSWYLRRSQRLPEMEDLVSYSEGRGFRGEERERVEKREKGPKFYGFCLLVSGLKPDIILEVFRNTRSRVYVV